MIIGTVWSAQDIVALVGVVLAGVPGIIAAVYARRAHLEVKRPNGEERTTGAVIADVAKTIGAATWNGEERRDTQPPPTTGG